MNTEHIKLLSLYWLWRKRHTSENKRKRIKRGLWVRPIFQEQARKEFGAGDNLIAEMHLNDAIKYRNFFRMGPVAFEELLSLVEPHIKKVDLRRPTISPSTRLAITLRDVCMIRYLAAGDSMTSLTYLFRVGLSTVSEIISETTQVIWETLKPTVLLPPNEDTWYKIADGFNNTWQFPNCIGAIDGKHITIQAPPNSGSECYNYKGTHSIVLMAIVTDQYTFSIVDIGSQGRQSDGGVFRDSLIGQKLQSNGLNIPRPRRISNDRQPLPFVIVGDEAFPLSDNLMRPYSSRGGLDIEKQIFNYRLSRARRISENAFGILVSRWRIFSKPIIAKLENIDNIVKATVCLHNFIMLKHNNSSYTTPSLIDREVDGHLNLGSWRQANSQLQSVGRVGANTSTQSARAVRDRFKSYFNEEGAVPWQWNRI